MKDTLKNSSLAYHANPTPGKLEIKPTKAMASQTDLAMAYSPGVAYPCGAIAKDPSKAAEYTARGNLVAVISNGTAVLGLGAIGALASKPVMEGKAVLFKKFANIDVFDLEIDERDPDKLIEIIASMEPTFGGINLEDIKAPECFIVEQALKERMNIPIFHDDQHGTAIVAGAAVYNGLRIVEKKIEEVTMVVTGAGAASIACCDLLVSMGMKVENISMIDSKGLIYKGRQEGMNPWKEKYARDTEQRTLEEVIDGADIFMGLSGPGVLSSEAVKTMADKPLILAMSNPTPEIMPDKARAARPDAIIATGRSDFPNQVNNVLCFPFLFRGALDCGASTINEEMKHACVKAIANLALKEPTEAVTRAYPGELIKFGEEYLIPKPFDARLIEEVPIAVVKAAMQSGVATRPIEDLDAYRRKLHSYVSSSGVFMYPIVNKARKIDTRIAFAEGENRDVLMAIQNIIDQDITTPVLIGREEIIKQRIAELGLRVEPGKDFEVMNPEQCDKDEKYWKHLHEKIGRQGVSVEGAQTTVRTNNTAFAAVLRSLGEVDGIICGKVGRFDQHLSLIQSILAHEDTQLSSVCAVLLQDGPLFLADPFINVNPTEEQLITTTEKSIEFVEMFGIKPKVALLSHSNFGTYDDPSAHKVKNAARRLRERHPDLQIDGEMHAISALNEELRNSIYQNNKISGRANLLIMPSMDAASIALGLSRSITGSGMVGPYLCGLNRAVHILIPSVSARGIFNMTALAANNTLTAK